MRTMIGIAIGLSALAWSSEALSQSGNELLEPCRDFVSEKYNSKNIFLQGHCSGMITSMYYSSSIFDKSLRFCAPKGVTTVQLASIAVKFIDDNPKDRHLSFQILA